LNPVHPVPKEKSGRGKGFNGKEFLIFNFIIFNQFLIFKNLATGNSLKTCAAPDTVLEILN